MSDSSAFTVARPSPRVASIDVLRGLTILTMIFVNDLAGLRDIPAWMKHFPSNQDGMTFVDVVFPAFLFIVGMSIPLAIGGRLDRGESSIRVFGHIAVRTVGLLIIGVFMVNMRGMNAAATGMSADLWTFLAFVGVILVWNRYPASGGAWRGLSSALRCLGAGLLVYMAVIYRRGEGEQITGMRTQWWGIVGLIGWAYLTACVAYLLFRRQPAGLMGVLGLLIAMYFGDKSGMLNFAGIVREYVSLGSHIGGHSAITVAGVLLTMYVLEPAADRTHARRIAGTLVFAAGLAAAGYLLRRPYGISKVQATPAWCLYSSAICCVLYAALYGIVDGLRSKRWAAFLTPAGANPLLAYILPGIVLAVLGMCGVEFLKTHYNAGLVGIVRSVLFALAMLALTGLLARLGIRLRL